MLSDLPVDIKAETLLAYLPKGSRVANTVGPHNRNAYEDVAAVTVDDNGKLVLSVSRSGMYDILPEQLFHPVDRFDNIPANEYKSRIKEEIEQQQAEEENARKFFSVSDRFMLELGAIVADVRQSFSDSSVIADIIADSMPAEFASNRFVKRSKEFLPMCRDIRGDRTLIACMLRYVLFEEGLRLISTDEKRIERDAAPRYNRSLDAAGADDASCYLGNEYEENVTVYNIRYWNNNECGDHFPEFIGELRAYEKFVNAFFIGIEEMVRFNVTTDSLPVRLSDEVAYNYLDYNTNI